MLSQYKKSGLLRLASGNSANWRVYFFQQNGPLEPLGPHESSGLLELEREISRSVFSLPQPVHFVPVRLAQMGCWTAKVVSQSLHLYS
jgi:hypothetical protein